MTQSIAQRAEASLKQYEFRLDPKDDCHVEYRLKGSTKWGSWNVYTKPESARFTVLENNK